MLNFDIDPGVLRPLTPRGTEPDLWQGRSIVSVVGFRFLRTRVLGVGVPFHRDFEEVNLRFYVRRRTDDGWRRGVVFVKEIVPRRLIAWVARARYGENYVALPMRRRIDVVAAGAGERRDVSYAWRRGGREESVRVAVRGEASAPAPGGEAEFITEHYWGYARRAGGGATEYRVEHPRWRVWTADEARLDCDASGLYGEALGEALRAPPASALLAEGSAVSVHRGRALDAFGSA